MVELSIIFKVYQPFSEYLKPENTFRFQEFCGDNNDLRVQDLLINLLLEGNEID